MLDQSMKDYIPWEEPQAGAGEEHEEEGVSETKCYELAELLFPIPLHCLGWRK